MAKQFRLWISHSSLHLTEAACGPTILGTYLSGNSHTANGKQGNAESTSGAVMVYACLALTVSVISVVGLDLTKRNIVMGRGIAVVHRGVAVQ